MKSFIHSTLKQLFILRFNLQKFFGLIRSFGGDDAHPTVTCFTHLFRLLSIYNPTSRLIKGNVEESVDLEVKSKPFTALISFYRKQQDQQRQDLKSHVENEIIRRILAGEMGAPTTENSSLSSTVCMVYHLAGFVAFKRKLFTRCDKCLTQLCDEKFKPEASSLTDIKDMGGLSRPSSTLFSLLNDGIEPAINGLKTEDIVSKNIVFEILDKVGGLNCSNLGCNQEHSQTLATEIIIYYITIRMYFLSKHHNKESLTSIIKSKQKFKEGKLN